MNITSATLALWLFPSTSGNIISTALGISSGASATASVASLTVALKQAEANEEKQLAQVGKDPVVKRELQRFEDVAAKAQSLEDILADPVARRVFLTANGLGDQADAVGLAKKALLSDPTDSSSLSARLSDINGAWQDAASRYRFDLFGVTVLKTEDYLEEVKSNYVGEKRLDMLDAQTPGLGTAILFKNAASKYDSSIKILGNALAREVVTTALNIPKEIAYQSLEAQQKAVETRLKIDQLQNPDFVDRLIQRYLLEVNGIGLSGLYI